MLYTNYFLLTFWLIYFFQHDCVFIRHVAMLHVNVIACLPLINVIFFHTFTDYRLNLKELWQLMELQYNLECLKAMKSLIIMSTWFESNEIPHYHVNLIWKQWIPPYHVTLVWMQWNPALSCQLGLKAMKSLTNTSTWFESSEILHYHVNLVWMQWNPSLSCQLGLKAMKSLIIMSTWFESNEIPHYHVNLVWMQWNPSLLCHLCLKAVKSLIIMSTLFESSEIPHYHVNFVRKQWNPSLLCQLCLKAVKSLIIISTLFESNEIHHHYANFVIKIPQHHVNFVWKQLSPSTLCQICLKAMKSLVLMQTLYESNETPQYYQNCLNAMKYLSILPILFESNEILHQQISTF